MAASFSSLLPATRDGRTLLAAGGVLGLLAAGQLCALAVYVAQGHSRLEAAPAPSVAEAVPAAASVASVSSPPPALPQPTPVLAAPNPALPVPAAVPLAVAPAPALVPTPTEIPPDTIFHPTPAPHLAANPSELLEQAKQLRARGDTQSALAKLREAQNVSPDNPEVIAEMALTYETMQLPERAASQWQRLYDMGESIGAPYYLAEARLHPSSSSHDPADSAGIDPTGTGRDRQGFQMNAELRILETHLEEQADPDAEKKLALRIIVKNRPGTAIDARKVKVETYFYDLVDGKDIVQTDAETGYRWLTTPVDWANDASEVLETTYRRPKQIPATAADLLPPPPAATPTPSGRHKGSKAPAPTPVPPPTPVVEQPTTRVYLGYIVRLYYNRQLQDVKADPERLLQSFPPPVTLPAD